MLSLFEKRMQVSTEIAEYKRANNLPVYDGKREREKIARVADSASDGMKDFAKNFMTELMDSRKLFSMTSIRKMLGLMITPVTT